MITTVMLRLVKLVPSYCNQTATSSKAVLDAMTLTDVLNYIHLLGIVRNLVEPTCWH